MPAKKRRFFRRSKPSVGNSTENVREKIAVKKVIEVIQEKKKRPTFTPHPEDHAKKRHGKAEFPNISQIISELKSELKGGGRVLWSKVIKLNVRQGLLAGACSLLLVLFVWQGVAVGGSLKHLFSVLSTRAKLQAEMTLWETIAAKYPTYRDANFKVAVIAYQLGDRQKEALYLQKTLSIDPNYIYARTLEKLVR